MLDVNVAQGDPGSTRFFLSLEDSLFRIFGGDRLKGAMTAFRVGDLPIESQMLTRSLNEAQRKVEAYFFDMRKHDQTSHLPSMTCRLFLRNLFEYDQVLNTQRDSIYAERRQALLAKDMSPILEDYSKKTMDDILEVPSLLYRS